MKPQDKWADISAVIYGYEDGGEAKARQAFADAIRLAREEGRREAFEKAEGVVMRECAAMAIEFTGQRIVESIRAMRDGAGEPGQLSDPMLCACVWPPHRKDTDCA